MTSIGELLRALGLVASLAGAAALVGAGCTDKSGNGHFVPPPGFGDVAGDGGAGDGGADDGGADDGAADDGGGDDAPADASGDVLPDLDGGVPDAVLDALAGDAI